jgi:hypothetical protein
MKHVTISLLLALSFSFPSSFGARADVFLHPTPPDVRMSFALGTGDLGELQTVLVRFAADEKFTAYHNVPRASGKLFFLGLRRDDSIVIIAVKSSVDAPVVIECSNVNGSARDFGWVETKLVEALRRGWPHLAINGL